MSIRAARGRRLGMTTTTLDAVSTSKTSSRTTSRSSTTSGSSTTSRDTATKRWAGRILTALPVLFLAFDAAMKLVAPAAILEASAKVGIAPALVRPIGIVLAVCLALYVVKRTAPLGAALLTGYLGGAVFAHARLGDPLLTHTLMPVIVGALLWGGLALRDARVRHLLARAG